MRRKRKYNKKTNLSSRNPSIKVGNIKMCSSDITDKTHHMNKDFLYTSDKEKIVPYGINNRYPYFLVYLNENCGDHNSIIRHKTNLILSGGLKYKDTEDNETLDIQVNPVDTLNDLAESCIRDLLLFNYFVVEVTYDIYGNPKNYYHIPAQKIATNRDKTLFEYRDDWRYENNGIIYEAFNPKQSSDTSRIFFYEGTSSGDNVIYPSVEYASVITPCLIDIAISKFNYNNITNHFSVSSIITMFDGSAFSDEVKESIYQDFENLYRGESGMKFMLNFQPSGQDGKAIQVDNISSNDWADAYLALSKINSEKIQTGHSITSPTLFGIKTPGSLGDKGELEMGYKIFQLNEGKNKRNQIIQAFNRLFTNSQVINNELEFIVESNPFMESETISDLLSYMTLNEVREMKGLKPIDGGDTIINGLGGQTQEK